MKILHCILFWLCILTADDIEGTSGCVVEYSIVLSNRTVMTHHLHLMVLKSIYSEEEVK